jgi:hypothetical protein
LADIDAELEQFAMDARRAQRLGNAHPADQVTDFGIRLRLTTATRSPSPVQAKAVAMPSDHGRWLDQDQGIEDLRPQSVESDPEQTVSQKAPKAMGALPPENDNLMSQRDELGFQRCAAANTERELGNESGPNRDHATDGMAAVLENPKSFSTVNSF